VFERFATLDDARGRDRSGAGLGLSIVAGIVATHDGTVRVEEGEAGGARLVVRLPAYAPQSSVGSGRSGRSAGSQPADLKVRSGGAPMV
jgi:two-component system OmpR family sensor kinase